MNRHMMELHGLPVALDHDKTIIPVYRVVIEEETGTRHWWVTVALQPLYVLVRTDCEDDGEGEGDGAGYREERIDVPSHAAANER